jgi:hypothetical protein
MAVADAVLFREQGRQRLGHWEGDTVMGSDLRHCVLTLVERKTGHAIIKKLAARNTEQVTRATTRAIRLASIRSSSERLVLSISFGKIFHDAEPQCKQIARSVSYVVRTGVDHHKLRLQCVTYLPDCSLNPSIEAYWITRLARGSIEGGTTSPSARAVLALITSSKVVGWSIGISAGLAPFNTLSR